MTPAKQLYLSRISLVIVVIIGAIFTSSCQRRAPSAISSRMSMVPSTQPVERTIIRFAVPDTDMARYESLSRRFEQENSDLKVELVSIEASLGQQQVVNSWAVLAKASDAFAYTPLLEGSEQQTFYDLTPLIAADARFEVQDFSQVAWSGVRWQEGIWGVPLALDTSLVFYRDEILAAAGLGAPESHWSTTDFSILITSLQQKADEAEVQYSFAPHAAIINTELVMRQAGLSNKLNTIALDDPQVVQAVNWYRDLLRTGAVADPVDGDRLIGRRDLIESQRAAMWSGSLADLADFASRPEIGMTLLPCPEEGQCDTEWSTIGCVMSAFTKQPQATWRWLAFLTRQTPEQLTGRAYLLPARRSIAEGTAFWQKVPPSLAAALRTSLGASPTTGGDVSYLQREELHNALLEILKGDAPVTARLALAQKAVQDRTRTASPARPPATASDSDGTPGTATGGERTTIVFAVDRPEERAFYRNLAETYEQQQDRVHLDIVQPHFEPGSPDFGLPALAAQADCFIWYGESGEARYADSLLPLDPFVQSDTAFDLEDFYPQWLAQFRLDGKHWAIPAAISPAVLRFNRNLFAAEGIATPAANWTLEDFISTAARLTDVEGDQLGFVPNADWTSELVFFLTQQAGPLVDFEQMPPRARFGDPEMRRALRWYLELTRLSSTNSAFRITPQSLGDSTALKNWDTVRTRQVQQGKVAMWIDLPPYYGGKAIDAKTLDAGIASLPSGKGRTNISAVTGYFIGRRTSNPEACWQWISFLSRQPTSIANAPPRQSVAEAPEYRNLVGAERATAFVTTIAGTGPTGLTYRGQEWLAPWFRWFMDASTQALADGDVDQHLELAEQQAEQYASCVAERSGFNEKTVWQECLAKTDPSVPSSLW